MTTLDEDWQTLTTRVKECRALDLTLLQKTGGLNAKQITTRANEAILAMRIAHLTYTAKLPEEDLSDRRLRTFKRYTDKLPLKLFQDALWLVPSLVNLVSLADALPLDGSSLPFDLRKIAVRCKNAVYFAPRRFTAVQLAFDEPRSRVLLFHTGRIVGTGCDGPMAAKLAVVRALKAISEEAGVQIGVKRFCVINEVGAVAMHAKLDCDAFANAHSADSHYDKQSFVGLAWRPQGERICAEAYSTGKCNLPGSRREREMLRSWARMCCELYRHSDRPTMALKFSEDVRNAHCETSTDSYDSRQPLAKKPKTTVFWEDDTVDSMVDCGLLDDLEGTNILDDVF